MVIREECKYREAGRELVRLRSRLGRLKLGLASLEQGSYPRCLVGQEWLFLAFSAERVRVISHMERLKACRKEFRSNGQATSRKRGTGVATGSRSGR